MAHFARLALAVVSAGLFVGGCMNQPNMPAAGAAGWRGTEPNTVDTIRFVVVSDRTGGHIPGAYEKAVAEINLLQPDLVISIGDSIEGYTDDPKLLTQQWQEFEGIVSKLKAPYFYCAGNHDVERGNPGGPTVARDVYLRKHAVQGNSYYSFDYKKSHFVVLDSTWMAKEEMFADEQFTWLREDMARAKNAEHILVFYHHPLWESKHWPTLATILPKGRTTIFNGHTHELAYHSSDGFPNFVLSATAAKSGLNTTDPSNQLMFAYVAINGGKPTVSFVPSGSIKPESYPQMITQMKDIMSSAAALSEIPAGGGEFTLSYKNPTASPMTVQYTITAPDWTIAPSSGKVDVAPGGTGEVKVTAKPSTPQAASPKIGETFAVTGGQTMSSERPLTIYQTADLGKLEAITVDGNGDEWAGVVPLELSSPSSLFQQAKAWKGPADSSCLIRVASSGDKLGMLIEVKDDQLITDRKLPWEQDALEICWDVRPQPEGGMTAGTGQLGVVPAASEGPASKLVWIPAGKESAVPEMIKTFSRRVEGGYVIELAIPIAELGLSGGTLSQGMVKIGVCQDDLDGSGTETVMKRLSITGTGDFYRSTAGYARFTQK